MQAHKVILAMGILLKDRQTAQRREGQGPARRAVPRLRREFWLLVVFLTCLAVADRAAALFVTPPEKGLSPPTPPVTTTDTGPEVGSSPEKIPAEDIKLQRHLEEIAPVPVRKQRVNSNAFSRMSGQTEELKPVAIPVSSVKRVRAAPQDLSEPLDRPERIFTIGSWAFVLACLGAAIIGLLKIRRLTSSG